MDCAAPNKCDTVLCHNVHICDSLPFLFDSSLFLYLYICTVISLFVGKIALMAYVGCVFI